MSQHEERLAGAFLLLHARHESVQILDVLAEVADIDARSLGAAVPAQIEGAHREAVLREPVGEFRVTRAVVLEPVDDHQHRPRRVRAGPPPLLVELEPQRPGEECLAVRHSFDVDHRRPRRAPETARRAGH